MTEEPDAQQDRLTAPMLRVRLEGPNAELGKVPVSDVANLLVLVERAVARAASVAVRRPSRKTGRREKVVAEASHLVLVGIESGSVVPVLELPVVRSDASDLQERVDTNDEQLAEVAVVQVLDVLTGKTKGHPYVVEVLAQMAEQLAVGERYSRIRFELAGTRVGRLQGDLDPPSAIRMQDQVMRYQEARTKGLLVGTLVEADFEAFSARLRSPDGVPVAVKFDPAIAEEIKDALTETGALQGWITYDPVTQTAQSIDLEKVVKNHQTALDLDPDYTFARHKSFDELQADQGVTGRFNVDDLADADSSEAELDAYDEALRRLSDA